MRPIRPDRYLHVTQAAELSGLTPGEVTRLFDRGVLGGFRLPTAQRARRIDPGSLRAHLAASGLSTLALDIAMDVARRAAS